MEKNIVFWVIGIIVLAAVLFNLGGLSSTGNVTKGVSPEPVVTVINSPVRQGVQMQVSVRDAETTSQEFKIYTRDGGYTGKRFFARSSRCGSRKVSGTYDCDLEYAVSTSMSSGTYYAQAKNRRGSMVGNKAMFTVV
ncbi:hypothetical protein HYV89_01535 [Candidatus Woesearchaeota archaeon]|nr:hypothetical protein [Candidatus Woesearchaeota archaeon]